MSKRILLVEDDAPLAAQIVEHLSIAGYEVTWRRDGATARDERVDAFRLVILDLGLPDAWGLDLLRAWRTDIDVPVMILSARNDTLDKVRAFDLGADDYVTKPFWPQELVARVQARLRRPSLQRGRSVRAGPLELDPDAARVTVGGEAVDLTRAEAALLEAFLRRPDTALTRQGLADAALDPERDADERRLDVHISRLRRKLGPEGARIETVWGIGYRLRVGDRR